MQKEKIDAQDVIKQIIEGIQDKKGKGIVVVDMLKLGNSVCDYFVICQGTYHIIMLSSPYTLHQFHL